MGKEFNKATQNGNQLEVTSNMSRNKAKLRKRKLQAKNLLSLASSFSYLLNQMLPIALLHASHTPILDLLSNLKPFSRSMMKKMPNMNNRPSAKH